MNVTASYFIGERFFGTSSLFQGADSIAYFCSTCGDIWARIVAGEGWQVEVVPCALHEPRTAIDWSKTPGSLINPFVTQRFVGAWAWAAVIEALPPEVLRHEFELHLNRYDKGLPND